MQKQVFDTTVLTIMEQFPQNIEHKNNLWTKIRTWTYELKKTQLEVQFITLDNLTYNSRNERLSMFDHNIVSSSLPVFNYKQPLNISLQK